MNDEAGCGCSSEKRRAMFADVDGCSFGGSESVGCEIFAWELGANVAGWRDHVCLHVLARGASSRADFDAGTSAWLSRAARYAWRVALGEALEEGWVEYATAVKWLRSSSAISSGCQDRKDAAWQMRTGPSDLRVNRSACATEVKRAGRMPALQGTTAIRRRQRFLRIGHFAPCNWWRRLKPALLKIESIVRRGGLLFSGRL